MAYVRRWAAIALAMMTACFSPDTVDNDAGSTSSSNDGTDPTESSDPSTTTSDPANPTDEGSSSNEGSEGSSGTHGSGSSSTSAASKGSSTTYTDRNPWTGEYTGSLLGQCKELGLPQVDGTFEMVVEPSGVLSLTVMTIAGTDTVLGDVADAGGVSASGTLSIIGACAFVGNLAPPDSGGSWTCEAGCTGTWALDLP